MVYQYRLWKLNSKSEQHEISCLYLCLFLNWRWIATLGIQFSEQKGISGEESFSALEKCFLLTNSRFKQRGHLSTSDCSDNWISNATYKNYILIFWNWSGTISVHSKVFEHIWQIWMYKPDHSSFLYLYDFCLEMNLKVMYVFHTVKVNLSFLSLHKAIAFFRGLMVHLYGVQKSPWSPSIFNLWKRAAQSYS